ncbi:MAG: hypothetical protein ACRC7V_08895 [Lachnospiraceae bacterium]
MMYIHYCKACNQLHMLNGHKMFCPKCDTTLSELQIPYLDYVSLNSTERSLLSELCQNEDYLKELTTTYRMYKYSKWYRTRMSNEASLSY